MTVVIYTILIDEIPVYVGSAYDYRYESRKVEHTKWRVKAQGIEIDRIRFVEIDKCENFDRIRKEGDCWEQLVLLGVKLENKKDPRKTHFVTTSESAMKSVKTRRKNGTIGNGGRSTAGKHLSESHKASLSRSLKGIVFSESRNQAISKARTGIKRPDVSIAIKRMIEEKKSIISELGVSWKEAGIIRMQRKSTE